MARSEPTATDTVDDVAERYLDLLRRCLNREIFLEEQFEDVVAWPVGGPLGDPAEVWPILHKAGMRLVRPLKDPSTRTEGLEWPVFGETMASVARLRNVQDLATRAIRDDVAGDFVETGVWRGGMVALMRGVLEAYGDTTRRVWACDSFAGLPEPDEENHPDDAGYTLPAGLREAAAVPRAEVEANLERYGLLDERVRFIEGWFRDTLHEAPIEEIAVLRLDGDLYESTIDALNALESKVTPGGFVIVDDYKSWEPCKKAVEDYRRDHGITAAIHDVDWTAVWWQKDGAA